ncbi:unnamed protein product [Porites evermanni]|uniref:Uncharacterized protein n=1 Tax=Porites evermanni TaxID=104178 RepID=A0ABN8Q2Y7_9CNID|nr:unnamed protein product [Porites evermanni]
MESKEDCIKRNRPPYYILEVEDNKKKYYDSVLDKFVDHSPTSNDFVRNYLLCLLKYYFIFLDFNDAALPGFNNYAIEMLISVVQNSVF